MSVESNIGKLVKDWRKDNMMTQEALANKISIVSGESCSVRQISRIEGGHIQMVSPRVLARLATVIDTIDYGNLITIEGN